MAIKLNELYPSPIYFEIFDKEYELKPFTLKVELWVLDNFETLEEFNKALLTPQEDRPFLIYEFLFQLLKDSPFKTVDELCKKILDKGKAKLIEITKHASKVINKTLIDSMPLIKSETRSRELKELREAKNENIEADYGIYYDKLARRYSYSIEQFYSLTTRQLFIMLQAIDDGDYSELEVKAALAGRELKPRMVSLDISEEQDKENMQAAETMLEEMKKRHEEIKNGKR